MKMKLKWLCASLVLLGFSTVNADERVTLKFAKSSSAYYQMSVQVAELLKQHGVSATVEESQGSVQNVVEATTRLGNYVFTTPYGLIANAQAGEKPFRDNAAYHEIRSLFPAPALAMHYVFLDEVDANQFSELTDEKVLIGKGTFSAREARKTFEDFGLTDLDLIEVELNSAVDAMKNKKIDGYVTASPWPTPTVVELSTSSKIKMLSMTDEELEKTGRSKTVIPVHAYPGMTSDIVTTSLAVGVRTTTKMSDEVAYQITKLFWENKAELEKTTAYWKAVTPETLDSIQGEWHPGAKKYYVEQGWLSE